MKTLNGAITVNIPYETLINAVRRLNRSEREALIEDLLALTSPRYLADIREARADYQAGRVKNHDALFGKANALRRR